MKCFVEAVGLLAPGFAGWQKSRPVLAGENAYRFEEFALPKLEILPPVERRRTGALVKLALAAGQDALAQGAWSATRLATVFASSDSDGEVIDEICRTVAGSDREISPTRFHNSVHNAAAGYWTIATGSHAPSTSVCALDWSVAAGLVEAASQIADGGGNVLLIVYEVPYPQPLFGVRPVRHAFGAALLLAQDGSSQSSACLDIVLTQGALPSRMDDPQLEDMRKDNSAARVLPLLAAIAQPSPAPIVLEYVAGNTLEITAIPCR